MDLGEDAVGLGHRPEVATRPNAEAARPRATGYPHTLAAVIRVDPDQQAVLDRVYEHRHADGNWPKLAPLDRELAKAGLETSGRAVINDARGLILHDAQEDTVRLSLQGLAAVPAARPLLDAYFRTVRDMIERYKDPDNEEGVYGENDLSALGLDHAIREELSELLRTDGWTFGQQRSSETDGWSYEISNLVMAGSRAKTAEELIAIRFPSAVLAAAESASGPSADPLTVRPGAVATADPDQPIDNVDADLLDRMPMARVLAAQATTNVAGHGLVMGLSGPWGSGKTSLLNLMAAAMREAESAYVVRFDPWLFSSSEELVLRFLNELSLQLKAEPFAHDKRLVDVAKRIGDYAVVLAPLTALAGLPWLGPVAAVPTGFIKRWRSKPPPPPPSALEQRQTVCEALAILDRRLVVFIDDLDRLQPDEIRDVVRLVKLVGDFPNTTYVLAYDQARVARALGGDDDVAEGQEYLEKIVQLSHEVPPIYAEELTRILQESIAAAVGDLSQYCFDQDAYVNTFGYVTALFKTLRDVRRYVNVLPGTLAQTRDEVELTDVLVLEAIRIRLPASFARMTSSKLALTETHDAFGHSLESKPLSADTINAIVEVAPPYAEELTAILRRLFPTTERHLGGAAYGSQWRGAWRRKRRVAHPDVFATYLNRALPPGTQSAALVDCLFRDLEEQDVLTNRLDGLDAAALESVLDRLEHYESEFPKQHAEVPTAVLYNQRHRLREGREHVFDIGARHKVGRVVLRILRRLDHAAVAAAVRRALPEIRTLSDQGDLVRMVGYREDSGARLVSEEDAADLQTEFFDRVLAASPETLAKEQELSSLLWWTESERPAEMAQRVQELIATDAFALALIRAALREMVSQTAGEAAVRRRYELQWSSLIELVPVELLAVRIKELAESLDREAADERTLEALDQAVRFAEHPDAEAADEESEWRNGSASEEQGP